MKINNFINGEYLESLDGKYLDNYNPATGKIYSMLADSQKDDVEIAYQAANNAFKDWSKTTPEIRANYLYKIADILESRIDEFAQAESIDQGKPVTLAKSMDISRSIHNFRFFAGAVLHHEESATDFNNQFLNYTSRKPIGVVGLISPWNLPLYLLTWKIAPAIATGNTVICKPSEFTSMTAYMLGDVLNRAQLPKGVCNIVMGNGLGAGIEIVKHKKICAISFTGGTKTGQKIAEITAPYFKKLSLELGGKNPNIIFADCDLEECVKTTVISSFLNQGEICLCGSRIFVQESIFDLFMEKFITETKKLVVGDPNNPETNIGAIVSKIHFDKIFSYINIVDSEGGKIVLGGDSPKFDNDLKGGYFINPTIITGLKNDCKILQEEIFGPVVTVTTFKTEEEVVDFANDVEYGLSATIWTENLSKAHRVAKNLDCGTVWINTWMTRDLRVPFGGVKSSGLGREGGKHSIEFYTEVKNVCLKY